MNYFIVLNDLENRKVMKGIAPGSFITKKAEDIGKFKIGSLRNVAVTAPYMHDGRFKTLKEVIEFYNDPRKIVPDAIGKDSLPAKPLDLTQQEKSDLEVFLVALTDKRFANN